MTRKPPLPYVQALTGYHYFRRAGFPPVTLPGQLMSPEFMAAYQEAMALAPAPIGASKIKAGSVAAAVAAYLMSKQFEQLAAGTQAMRRAILQRFRDDHGDKPIGLMPPKFIALVLENMKPHAARNYFKAIRALCQFAVGAELIKVDPTVGMKSPKVKTQRRRPWTPAEIEAYEATHAIGTKARLALALGLYTVQRRGDVLRMGRQHVRNGMLAVRQQKTGAALHLPLRQELRAIIEATPGDHLTFLITKSGKPYNGNDFSDQFRQWCEEAGLSDACTFHGLRASGCTVLADAGCTAHEIAAWSGHMTLKEVERYTKAADQKRLAASALVKVRTAEPKDISGTPAVKPT
jgi:integrase